ncbi:MAG: hypothetical protein V3R99_02690, partial [Thermoguttaceae bacterium]
MYFRSLTIGVLMLACCGGEARATYKDLIGYPDLVELVDLLGLGVPTGVGIPITQVEASASGGGTDPVYLPVASDPELAGKEIIDASDLGTGLPSTHALRVGLNFYGNDTSIAPALGSSADDPVRVYLAEDWLENVLRIEIRNIPVVTGSRIANHSWIGADENASVTADILRRMDYLVDERDHIQIVGLPNSASDDLPLFKDAYNVISVGRTDALHKFDTVGVPGNDTYTAGRVAPTLVTSGFSKADSVATSWSTPIVAAST